MNERNRSKKRCRVVIYAATNPIMDYSSFLIKSQSNNANLQHKAFQTKQHKPVLVQPH